MLADARSSTPYLLRENGMIRIDFSSDLGEGFGPWQMGCDAANL
jgi:hypothetical protein